MTPRVRSYFRSSDTGNGRVAKLFLCRTNARSYLGITSVLTLSAEPLPPPELGLRVAIVVIVVAVVAAVVAVVAGRAGLPAAVAAVTVVVPIVLKTK